MKNQYKLRKFRCLGCGKIVELRRPQEKTKYCSLKCWRKSKHLQRKTGKIVRCEWCSKEVYKPKSLLTHKHHFCSRGCANKYQAKNKLTFTCKICGKQFNWSKSRLKQEMPKYCSIECRNKDKEWIQNACIKGNLVQQNKKGLNKLELTGKKILQDLGVKFQEQVLMFNKFLVDVLILDKKIIIQWDGDYWHNKAERNKLDKSQDAYLTKCGYKVIRIKESQIKNNRGKTYDYLKRTI